MARIGTAALVVVMLVPVAAGCGGGPPAASHGSSAPLSLSPSAAHQAGGSVCDWAAFPRQLSVPVRYLVGEGDRINIDAFLAKVGGPR